MTTTLAPDGAPFRIVDLFAGPGGFDLAARQLGITSIGIEFDRAAVATRLANGLETIHGDVTEYFPIEATFDGCNVLAGGPPCQSFSSAGNGDGRLVLGDIFRFADRLADREDPDEIRAEANTSVLDAKSWLVLEPLRWALEAIDCGRPFDAIVLEQVPPVLPIWQHYAKILRDNGYLVPEPRVVRMEEHGVPQTRKRAILMARRAGAFATAPQFPTPTHRRFYNGAEVGGPDLKPVVSMGDVLPDWPTPFNVVAFYKSSSSVRTHLEPSVTATGKIAHSCNYYPSGPAWAADRERRFSPSEAGRLQTFPAEPDWTWAGTDRGQQIGNALPPLMALRLLAAALGLDSDVVAAALAQHHPYATRG